MRSINVQRRHQLGQERIRNISENLADEFERKFGINWNWEGSRLMLYHSGASGYLHPFEDAIEISLRLGLSLIALKPIIETALVRRLDEILAEEAALLAG